MTEETRIVEESTAAEVAAVVEAAEAETTTAEAVIEGIVENVSDAVVETVQTVTAEAEEIAETVSEAVEAPVAEAEAVTEAIVESVSDAVAEAVETVTAEAEEIVETVSEAVEAPVAEAEAVTEAIVESVSDAVAEAVEAVTAEAEEIAETVSETVTQAVAEAVESVTEKVAEAVESVTETVTETVSGATVTPVAEAAAESASDEASDDESADGGDRRVVRLSVGQEVTGIIKRITDFGAFVDIGAGRDGLIHISELAVGRVNQVADVVQAGQEMTLWIKKLDRARNRISLTLISPDTKTIKDINDGDVVPGTVARLVPYGAFIDLGVGTDALLHVREMSNNYVAKPEDVVKIGETLDVRILTVNRRRRRIDVSLKGLRDEPEPEMAEMDAAAAALGVKEDQEIVDSYENVQVLSPMELAFKRAMEAEGVEVETASKRKGGRSKKNRSMQDEIIRRTLETMRE